MLTKFFILIFIKVLINNSLGENEMPSAWKTEMKKMFTEELGVELNKLKETLEKRFELMAKLENSLGDEFGKKLEQLEETLGIKLETKLENNLSEKLKSKLEENLEKKLEVNLGKKLEDSLKNRLKPALEENISKTIEDKLEIKIEENLKEKLERKLEQSLDKKFEDKFEKKQNTSKAGEWIRTSLKDVILLSGRALVAGYLKYDKDLCPLWIARNYIGYQNLVVGKLNANQRYVQYASITSAITYEYSSDHSMEVFSAPPEKVRWVECRDGVVPPNAVVGGQYNGENIYVGRARQYSGLVPGWVRPSDKVLYIVYREEKFNHSTYEVLCLV